MSKVNLNKKSVKQQGGAMIPSQPAMSNQQPMMQPLQEQVDPAIQEISQFFASSMQQGGKPEEIVINLMQQEVDQNTIAQALMMVGYQEDDITMLFQSVQKMSQPKPASANEVNRNPQELSRNQEIASNQKGPVAVDPIEMAKSGIEIKPENKGKFTRWAKARGMSVSEAYNKVMGNTDAYPPSVVKMANFAKNAAGWKKMNGGEGVEGMRQREGSYNPPNRKYTLDPRFAEDGVEVTEDDQIKQADEFEKRALALAQKEIEEQEAGLTAEKNAFATASTPIDTTQNINKSNEGIIGGSNFFNPNAFKTGNNFSFGKAANVLGEGLNNMISNDDTDGDGVKDGSFRDWSGKIERNKLQKFADTTYEIGSLDMSQGNKDAALAFANQYNKENPEEDALGNIINSNLEINEEPLDAFSTWLNQNTDALSGKALEAFKGIKNKMFSKKVIDNTEPGVNEETLEGDGRWVNPIYRVNPPELKNGSELPKAQFSMNDAFEDNGFSSYGFDPFNDDLTSFMENAGQTNYMQDVENVNRASIDEGTYGKREMSNEPREKTAAELFAEINIPEVTADAGGLKGFLDRSKDSVLATAFGDVSDFAVKGADVVNDYFEDKNIMDAKDEMRGNIVADNIYGTKTDAFNRRGTFDVNSGLMGSEADRTTGLFLKKGGGTDNEGFRKLPDFVQNQILAGMRTGGEAAYLANRDRVIKREMAKAKGGGETVSVDSAMLAKLIAAGADIEIL